MAVEVNALVFWSLVFCCWQVKGSTPPELSQEETNQHGSLRLICKHNSSSVFWWLNTTQFEIGNNNGSCQEIGNRPPFMKCDCIPPTYSCVFNLSDELLGKNTACRCSVVANEGQIFSNVIPLVIPERITTTAAVINDYTSPAKTDSCTCPHSDWSLMGFCECLAAGGCIILVELVLLCAWCFKNGLLSKDVNVKKHFKDDVISHIDTKTKNLSADVVDRVTKEINELLSKAVNVKEHFKDDVISHIDTKITGLSADIAKHVTQEIKEQIKNDVIKEIKTEMENLSKHVSNLMKEKQDLIQKRQDDQTQLTNSHLQADQSNSE